MVYMPEPARARIDVATAIDRLLNREPPSGYTREWSVHIAAPLSQTRFTSQQVIIVSVDGEHKALATRFILDVAEKCPFHTLPNRSSRAVKGVIHIRGSLI